MDYQDLISPSCDPLPCPWPRIPFQPRLWLFVLTGVGVEDADLQPHWAGLTPTSLPPYPTYPCFQWAEPVILLRAGAVLRGKGWIYSDEGAPGSPDTALAQPAVLGNGPSGAWRSPPPSLSCLRFLTLLLLLTAERSLLSPVAGRCASGWVLAYSRGCWISKSRGSCFPPAHQCFP